MVNTDFGKPSGVAPRRNQIFDAIRAVEDCSGAFADEQSVKRALSALQRGPIRFRRNNVIACEGDAADYIFLVVGGVVRSCKTFKNGTRNVVAFYLPGALFGWSDQNYSLSVEAASDAMVLFFKRKALTSVAARENCVASFLLELATIELRRAQEHGLLMSRSAKCRVAAFLTDLSQRSGGTGLVSLPMSHQDIADHLGLTIETLSRAITGLERSGLVARVSHRTLMVRNDYSLSQLTD